MRNLHDSLIEHKNGECVSRILHSHRAYHYDKIPHYENNYDSFRDQLILSQNLTGRFIIKH